MIQVCPGQLVENQQLASYSHCYASLVAMPLLRSSCEKSMQVVVYARALERYIKALLRSLLSRSPPVKRWRAQNDLGASAHFKQACTNDDSEMLAAALTVQPIAPLCAQSL